LCHHAGAGFCRVLTGFPPQSLLGELTALPETLSWIWGWEMKAWERKEVRNKRGREGDMKKGREES